jgi:hypothetical protein
MQDCVITTPIHNMRTKHMMGPAHIVVVDETALEDRKGGDQEQGGGLGGGAEDSSSSGSDSGSEENEGGEEVVVIEPGGERRSLKAIQRTGIENESASQGSSGSELEEAEGEEGVEGARGLLEGLQGGGVDTEAEELQQFESVLPGPVAPSELTAVIEEVLSCHDPLGIRVKDIASRPNVRCGWTSLLTIHIFALQTVMQAHVGTAYNCMRYIEQG